MIRRVYAKRDCFLTNYRVLSQPMTGSNTGASEILYLFKNEKAPQSGSRANALIQFDMSGTSGTQYVLKMFDAEHEETIPVDYRVLIRPVEQNWTEGRGHDLDDYGDLGAANWISASNGVAWQVPGGFPSGALSATFSFEDGNEDLEVDVTSLMSASAKGFFLQIDPAYDGDGQDYYVKMFHSRHTHFPNKRPYIEVRTTDWTGSLLSSSADPSGALVVSLYDLKDVYRTSETTTLHLQVRPRDWNPSVVATGSSVTPGCVLTKAYYSLVDDLTEEIVVPFGTGALDHTRLSYNDDGNYFQVHMGSLPTETVLRFEFLYQSGTDWTHVHGNDFKFRIK